MLSDGTWTYTWKQGRQLATMSDGTTTWTYTYNADGLRTKRSNGTKTYSYVYNGSQLSQMTVDGSTAYFTYDATGKPMTMRYNGESYLYITNMQGDVIAISGNLGNLMVYYTYDAWGNLLSVTGNGADTIGVLNPLRYRGYVYDSETGLYYLQSRYYDPEMGRFINADGFVSTGQDIIGHNMFAYCGNNPVNRKDPMGVFWKEIGDFFSKVWKGIKTWAKNTFGSESSTTVTIADSETPIIPDPSPITVKTGSETTQTLLTHGDSSKPISVYADKNVRHPIKSSSAGIKINIVDFTLDLSVGLDDFGIYGSLADGKNTNILGVKLNLSEFKVGFEGATEIQWDNTTERAYTNVSVNGWAIVAAYILVTTGQLGQSPSYGY